MAMTDEVFAGGIPEIYDQYLVPMVFEPYARDIAERIARFQPHSVLEVAAGTGALTRALAKVLPPDVAITASDLNPPMLEMAKSRQGADSRTSWLQADGLALPFDDGSFDVVACQFGVMFFPEKNKGFREALRVLKPGGHYVFAVWDKVANNDFINVVSEALDHEFPADPPRFMQRTPHGYHDPDVIEGDVRAAGFSAATVETVDHKSAAHSALEAATGYCQGNPLRGEIEERAPGRLQDITLHVARALRKAFGEGPIDGRLRALVVTATR